MDFFRAQAEARSRSRLLTLAFSACMLAVVLVLDFVVLAILRIVTALGDDPEPMGRSVLDWALAHPGTVIATSLVVAGFIGIASLTRMLQLRDGGGQVARSLGGIRVERGTPDPRRRQLHNVVEEMALASGVPVPEVYVLEGEGGINAFAAGSTPANAAVAVTRGALMHLNRDQLQGVIAHEFSHILNGDMRLATRLVGLVFGLMAVSLAGRMLMRAAASERKGSVHAALLGLVVMSIGQIGFWAGRVLQAWISRTREHLADSSAVQFTRQPEGLRDALIRAAALGMPVGKAGAAFEEVAHMLLVPVRQRLLATHPPLLERIRALDPHVNQARLESMLRRARDQMQAERAAAPQAPPATGTAPEPPGSTAIAGTIAGTLAGTAVSAASPGAVALIAATAGEPAPRHLEYAMAVRKALPPSLRVSAGGGEKAQALLLALVIHARPASRGQRLALVGERLGGTVVAEIEAVSAASAMLAPMLRLPAVLQLIPALRALPEAERVLYVRTVREITRLDPQASVFEYALEKIVIRALSARHAARELHGRRALDDCAASLGIVFAVLARHGTRDTDQARQAYEAGLAPLLPRVRPAYAVIEDWVPLFDHALDELGELRIAAKQLLIEALVRTIAHDASLAPAEAELLRAICAVLECPLPPVLPQMD